MRRRLIFAVVVVLAAACNSDNRNSIPGNAVAPSATGSPPGSPLSNVSGSWSGTVAYEYPDDWCACCNRNAYQASATIIQNGTEVSASIHTVCFDEQFTGALQDGRLAGTAKVSSGDVVWDGQAAGQAMTTGFYLATNDLRRDGHPVSGYRIAFSK